MAPFLFLTLVVIGFVYLLITFIFPSQKTSKKLSQSAMRSVTDDPKFAKYKGMVYDDCNEKTVGELVQFMRKYGGGKVVRRNGVNTKELYPKERDDLYKIFYDVILPCKALSFGTKRRVKDFFIDLGLDKLPKDGIDNSLMEKKDESKKVEATTQLKVEESKNTETLKPQVKEVATNLPPKEEVTGNVNVNAGDAKVKVEEIDISSFDLEAAKESLNLKAQANKDTASLETPSANSLTSRKKRAISLDELLNSNISLHQSTQMQPSMSASEKTQSESVLASSSILPNNTATQEEPARNMYSKTNTSSPIDIEARLAKMNFVIDREPVAETVVTASEATRELDSYELEKLKQIQERGDKAVVEVLETLPTEEYKVLNKVKLNFMDDAPVFDHVVIGPNEVCFMNTKAFGLSTIEGGDDEAHIDINEDGEWILKKNHTRRSLTDPTKEIAQCQEKVISLLSQIGKVATSFAVVFANGMLTYHSNTKLPCDVVSINTLTEYLHKPDEAPLNADERQKIISRLSKFEVRSTSAS